MVKHLPSSKKKPVSHIKHTDFCALTTYLHPGTPTSAQTPNTKSKYLPIGQIVYYLSHRPWFNRKCYLHYVHVKMPSNVLQPGSTQISRSLTYPSAHKLHSLFVKTSAQFTGLHLPSLPNSHPLSHWTQLPDTCSMHLLIRHVLFSAIV